MIIQSFLRRNLRKQFRKALIKFFIQIQGRIKRIFFDLFEFILLYRSESNDLAIRLARQYTGNYDILVLDKYMNTNYERKIKKIYFCLVLIMVI
jgi:hypothetical protein